MALVPWRPFPELASFRQEMDRLFNRFIGLFPGGEEALGMWAPSIDVSETKEAVRIRAELPGLEAKDLDVSVSHDVLTIKGEKRQEREEKDEHFHRVERTYGAFTRSVQLPAAVGSEKAKATFKNGVLTITMPKTEESKRRAIQIEAK